MGDKFAPTPDYPDPDAATIAAIEADGRFKVTPQGRARRGVGEVRHSGKPTPIARISNREMKLLEKHLLVLEQGGIDGTRGAIPPPIEERKALAEIQRLTRGAVSPRPSRTAWRRWDHDQGRLGVDSRGAIQMSWSFVSRLGSTRPLGANLAYSLRQPRFRAQAWRSDLRFVRA